MQRIPENLDLLLPYGEALRLFLEQPFISASDLKHTLRARGVFQGRTEKRDTIPILTCCLLSPAEFDELREQQATREDNPKTMTRTLAWNSNRSLLDAIPPNLRLADLLGDDSSRYKIIGTPTFVPVGNNPNHLVCEFDAEREDLSKSWTRTNSVFKGCLRIEKINQGKQVKFVLTNTADETKDMNHRLVRHLERHFKEAGDVAHDAEIETIRFSSFDNDGRISFFRSLADRLACADFEFQKMTDLGACPEDRLPLPSKLKEMLENVSSLTLNGQALQDTFFIKDKSCHKHLLFYAVEADLRFDWRGSKGTCSVRFEFPEFASTKDRDIEFEANISTVSVEPGGPPVNKIELKEELLRRINDYKLKQFDKYRHRADAPEMVNESQPPSAPVQMEADFALSSTPAPKRSSIRR